MDDFTPTKASEFEFITANFYRAGMKTLETHPNGWSRSNSDGTNCIQFTSYGWSYCDCGGCIDGIENIQTETDIKFIPIGFLSPELIYQYVQYFDLRDVPQEYIDDDWWHSNFCPSPHQ